MFPFFSVCDRHFPGAINAVSSGRGEKHVGVEMKNISKVKTRILSETSPHQQPSLPVLATKSFSDGVVHSQGPSFKTTESVYIDIIFFSQLPEVETCEMSLKSSKCSGLSCMAEREKG